MAELRFSRSLYSPDAVRKAVAAFAGLASLDVVDAGSDLVVSISNPHPKYADRLADELANYVLGLSAGAA